MIEQTFAGGVRSRTVAGGKVQVPVVVTLNGVATEMTLPDATKLLAGLTAAIAVVAESEEALRGGHHFVFGRSEFGMSTPPSPFPA
jgi:hypothetical protein